MMQVITCSIAQPIWTNPVTGTNPSQDNPYTAGQVVADNISVSGIGRGPGISAASANNRYNASGWSTTEPGMDDYFYFSLAPATGYSIDMISLEYSGQASGSGPSSLFLRSSLDGFVGDIGSPTAPGGMIDLSGPAFQDIDDTITFRLYGWGATGSGGTFSINDFTFHGQVMQSNQPSISITPGSLENFVAQSSIPSAELPYQVSASQLVGDLSIIPPPGFEITLSSGTGYLAFPSTLTLPSTGGNVPITTVFVRMHAATLGPLQAEINHSGTGVADATLELRGNVIAAEPGLQGTISVEAVSGNSVDLSFTPGNGSKRILVARQDSPVNASPMDGHTYAPDNVFGTGDSTGTGNFVVYAGPGNAVTVSGLLPGTTYHFALFEYNDANIPGAENYLSILPGATQAATPSGVMTYTWTAGAGDWSLAGNWTPARLQPLPTDRLQFNSGDTIEISGITSQSFAHLTVTNSTMVHLSAMGDALLEITGLDGPGLVIDANAGLSLEDGAAITISLMNGSAGTISGALHLIGEPHRLLASISNAVQFQAGATLFLGSGFAGNVFGVSPAGAFVFNQGSLLHQSSGATPFGSNNSLLFQPGSLFRYSGTSAPSFNGRNYADVEIALPGSNAINITGSNAVTIDNLSIVSGTVNFNMTNSGHSIRGNLSIAMGASLNFLPANPCVINLYGTVLQTISNQGIISSNANVQFRLDNAAGFELIGELTLGTASMELVNGMVNLAGASLELSSILGAAPGRYLRTSGGGTLKLTGIGAEAKLFPVGDSHYNPVTIEAGNGLDWTARVEDGLVVNDPAFAGNVSKAVQRSWIISHSVGSPAPGATITFQYNDLTDVGSAFNSLADVRIWRKVGDNWIPAGSSQNPMGAPGGDRFVLLTGWTSFSRFAIANMDAPLPVRFENVRAFGDPRGILVEWNNLTESDVAGYSIERSPDGRDFHTIGDLAPRSNNGGSESYLFLDQFPPAGFNFYRIRCEENSGQPFYSAIVMADRRVDARDLHIYPNPVNAGGTLNLQLAEIPEGGLSVSFVDALGRRIGSRRIDRSNGQGIHSIPVPPGCRGIVWVQVKGRGIDFSRQILVN